jgi:glutaminyl-peptide cyclotransferase
MSLPSLRAACGAILIGAALAQLGACGREAEDADAGARPAILPAFAQPRNNADATPPRVPYSADTPLLVARAAHRWPHDTLAYTQGLLVVGDRLLESTGLEGRSELRAVDLASGRVERRAALPDSEFGEGIAAVGGRVYQLTWTTGLGRVYDARTLAVVDSFRYEGEGWGLASDDSLLWFSDGTSTLRVVDPRGFRVVRRVRVTEAGKPVYMLNELEWVRGELWANVYRTTLIARIDPGTGHVLGWIDLRGLLDAWQRDRLADAGGVANGIAYDPRGERVLVTGKDWPFVFQLDSLPLAPGEAGPVAPR